MRRIWYLDDGRGSATCLTGLEPEDMYCFPSVVIGSAARTVPPYFVVAPLSEYDVEMWIGLDWVWVRVILAQQRLDNGLSSCESLEKW
jgi:hypothetical protein